MSKFAKSKSALVLDYIFLMFFALTGFAGLFFYAYKTLITGEGMSLVFIAFPLLFLFISLWFISLIKEKRKKEVIR